MSAFKAKADMTRTGQFLTQSGRSLCCVPIGLHCQRSTLALSFLEASLSELTSPMSQVGTISANGDPEIGRMIAEAMDKVGNEGVIILPDIALQQSGMVGQT